MICLELEIDILGLTVTMGVYSHFHMSSELLVNKLYYLVRIYGIDE